MTKQRITRQLENNGYIVEPIDKEGHIFSATTSWDGRVLFGTLHYLYKEIIG